MIALRRPASLLAAVLVAALIAPPAGANQEVRVAPAAVSDQQGRVGAAGPTWVKTGPGPNLQYEDGYYGSSAAVSGDRFVVGAVVAALRIPETGSPWSLYYDVGAAYLHEAQPDGSITTEEFRPGDFPGEDPGTNDMEYGRSVDIDGNRFVVGARLADGDTVDVRTGAAYVYDRNGGSWSETKLVASDGAHLDWFGYSVAVSGDRVVVGQKDNDSPSGGNGPGAVYVYEYNGGSWDETKLTASDGEAADRLGTSVAIDGDVIVAGGDQNGGYDDDEGPGLAYVFTWDGDEWLEQELAPTGTSVNDAFGRSVAVDGSRIVVGSPYDDTNGTDSGAAYVFEKQPNGTWSQTAKLTPSDPDSGDSFGWAVAVEGGRVFVGAYGWDDGATSGAGAVYVFTGSGSSWAETKLNPHAASGDHFGTSVASDAHRLVAGASREDVVEGGETYTNVGAAYLYEWHYCGGVAATKVGTTGDDNPLSGTAADDVIVGLAGNDVIDGKGGNDIICAGEGNDEVRGKAGNDKLYGEGGNDKLNGAQGNDVVDGGPGKDTAVYFGASGGVTVDLSASSGGGADQGSDTLKAIEHVMGSLFGDMLTGNAGGNRLKGLAGNDQLWGLAGMDTLVGASNNDTIYGGPGDDVLQGKAGIDTVRGGGGNDTIEGNLGRDTLFGDAGNDQIKGGEGNDTLNGGTGTDTLNGGTGTDTCTNGPTYISC